jgi:hypothetical protein
LENKTLFDHVNDAYAKFYNPSEHLAADEVTMMFFKGELLSTNTLLTNMNALV